MRIREPKSTALIFQTGKIVITGAKSENDAQLAARKYARIIQKLGFRAQFTNFKIQNIVGSCDIGFPLRLEGLAYQYNEKTSYEPELFPGLIFRLSQPRVVILIFVSGKIVLTGAKTKDEVNSAFEYIYPILVQFKKDITDLTDELEIEDDDLNQLNELDSLHNNNNNNINGLMSGFGAQQDIDIQTFGNNNNNGNNDNNMNDSLIDDGFVAAPQMSTGMSGMTDTNQNEMKDDDNSNNMNSNSQNNSNFNPLFMDDDDDDDDINI